MNNEMLTYYQNELRSLREQGSLFAEAHPKIAERLKLGHGEIEDPTVARILESVAFLTARINHKIDHEHQLIINDLLSILYPIALLPAPAMSIISYAPKAQLDKPYTIPRETEVIAETTHGKACKFSTCFDVTIRPIKIGNISLRSDPIVDSKHRDNRIKSALSIELHNDHQNNTLHDYDLNQVRFHIDMALPDSMSLYELIFSQLSYIVINNPENPEKAISLSAKDVIHSVGFDTCDAIIPTPTQGADSQRLLLEYFSFPKKFLFFDMKGLSKTLPNFCSEKIVIHLMFTERNKLLETRIKKSSLTLNCTPIVNLFKHVGEPIQYDKYRTDYHIIADSHTNADAIDVYSVRKINISNEKYAEKINCSQYFGRRFDSKSYDSQLYWQIKQKPCWQTGNHNTPGSEYFASFSEIVGKTAFPNSLTLTPYLICTNRELPNYLPHGKSKSSFKFSNNTHDVIENICTITEFTSPKYRKDDTNQGLQLLTQVTLNQSSLHDSEHALETLKAHLELYSFTDSQVNERVQKSLTKLKSKYITIRHPDKLKQGFCQGTLVCLTLDESQLLNNEAILLGKLIHEYLTLSCSINSFVKLDIISKQRGKIHTFTPRLGVKETI